MKTFFILLLLPFIVFGQEKKFTTSMITPKYKMIVSEDRLHIGWVDGDITARVDFNHVDDGYSITSPKGTVNVLPLGINSNVVGTMVGDTLLFRNLWNNVDWRLTAIPGGIKTMMVVKTVTAPDSFTFAVSQFGAFTFLPPKAWDSNGKELTISYSYKDGLYGIKGKKPDTLAVVKFPVFVDPSITVAAPIYGYSQGSDATYATARDEDPATGATAANLFLIGNRHNGTNYLVERGIAGWSLAGLPPTDSDSITTITSAWIVIAGAANGVGVDGGHTNILVASGQWTGGVSADDYPDFVGRAAGGGHTGIKNLFGSFRRSGFTGFADSAWSTTEYSQPDTFVAFNYTADTLKAHAGDTLRTVFVHKFDSANATPGGSVANYVNWGISPAPSLEITYTRIAIGLKPSGVALTATSGSTVRIDSIEGGSAIHRYAVRVNNANRWLDSLGYFDDAPKYMLKPNWQGVSFGVPPNSLIHVRARSISSIDSSALDSVSVGNPSAGSGSGSTNLIVLNKTTGVKDTLDLTKVAIAFYDTTGSVQGTDPDTLELLGSGGGGAGAIYALVAGGATSQIDTVQVFNGGGSISGSRLIINRATRLVEDTVKVDVYDPNNPMNPIPKFLYDLIDTTGNQ